MSMLVPPYKWK